MHWNCGSWRSRVCLQAWGCLSLLLAGTSMAAEKHYLQLNGRLVDVPYQWQLPDGEVIRKGVSDQDARVAVVPRKGREDYVLETLWDRIPVNVPARCWNLRAEEFEDCVRIGPREDSARQREEDLEFERQVAARQQNREARVAWASEQVGLDRVSRILETALTEHRRWLASGAGSGTFLCHRLKGALAAMPSQETLPRHDMMAGKRDAVVAYVQAAQSGNWRAAAGLFDAMIADEDFESARVIVAWLLKQNIPAGYNKLSTWLTAMSGYDGGSGSGTALIESLRRHAAWEGDPVAQMDLANLLENAGDKANATRLRECAIGQNPELVR